MKTFFIGLAFLSFTITGYSQEFVNKITGALSGNKRIKHALDYLENTEDENGKPITTLYMRYIPIDPAVDYDDVANWSTIFLVDKQTGKRYRVIDGNGIPLTLNSAFSFYNRGGEIGFSLSFERLPESTRNIDIISHEVLWFKNIAIDPERDDDDSFFRFKYFFKSLQFFTTVPAAKVYFTMDGYFKKDLYVDQHYATNKRPNSCNADGIITFAYPNEMKDKEISIKAEAYGESDKQLKATWQLRRAPKVTTCTNFIQLNNS